MSVTTGHTFVGRAAELERIAEAVSRVRRGHTQFVVIEAPAGVGKTSLLRQALEGLEDWPEFGVVLDERMREVPGGAALNLLQVPGTTLENLDRVLTVRLRDAARLDTPALVTVHELQHVDERSAELFWQGLSVLDQGPVLVIMTVRPTQRPEVRRLIRLAQASPHGTHISLDPLPDWQIMEYLESRLRLPVGMAVARAVRRATDGYPRLVESVADRLCARHLGKRGLDHTLRTLFADPETTAFLRDIAAAVETPDAQTRQALYVLAAAGQPLSKHQMEQVLAQEVDVAALMGTHVVRWDAPTFGYAIEHVTVARGLRAELTREAEAEIHRALMGITTGFDALRHETAALMLDSGNDHRERLHGQLMEASQTAAHAGDIEQAFELTHLASTVCASERTLAQLVQLGVSVGRAKQLTEFADVVEALPPSQTRAGLMALIALERNEPDQALFELERYVSAHWSPEGLAVYAHAVSDTSAHMVVRGSPLQSNELLQRTLRQLESWEQQLRNERAKLISQTTGEKPPAYQLGHVTSLKAMIQVWHVACQQNPAEAGAIIHEITAAIDRLEQYPGTEIVRTALRSVRGARLRQLGDIQAAYEDLLPAAVTNAALTSYAIHAKVQLALVLFSAGLWHEAQEYAAAAAGHTLLQNEDTTSLMAYAVACLVPAARGDWEAVAEIVETLERLPHPGPVVTGLVTWVKAWGASATGDAEASAQLLTTMRHSSEGWITVGVEPAGMLARELFYAGMPEMLRVIMRSLASEVPARDDVSLTAVTGTRAFEAWSRGEAEEAMTHFEEVARYFDAAPPLRPTQLTGEGGGRGLYRALLGLDMAALVAQYPERLDRYRSSVLEHLVWSATVFQSCHAKTLLARSTELLNTIRSQARSLAPERTSDRALPALTAPVPQVVLPVMEQLSPREREIAVAVSRGSTNREVAENLVISVRTVEYHVANILAKLGLHSRRELRQLLRQ
ncbi:LuxR family transcriptional regulator [Nesterenkonia flava]|uniref:LuxR family transcriptional regulator n=1 Tax=Nesterenkonia flava TaxID=469799 RepID=A0ABU1FV58_9MICC|nr:LuxR family transcriptional regulator [Nesterenkonia flava]MDR5712555.1 LuxR family transcriptional regulator [Nesterenkonia flava]